MKTYIKNGVIITPERSLVNSVLAIENGKIIDINSAPIPNERENIVIDANGLYVVPGFIDIHFHGAMGYDTMDANLESLQILSNYCAKHGVTTIYPTTWSAAPTDILEAINCVKQGQRKVNGAQIMGVHIEGPYIDQKFRGAQLPSMLRIPNKKEYKAWFETGIVKIITCAPELTGCEEFIKEARRHNVRISIGHSQATYEQVIAAANIGVTQATHIFNGMVGLHHRDPGTVGGILDEDRILAQVICDGVHLNQAIVRLILKTKTNTRIILITDSIRGAGLPDGNYENKGQKFSVRNAIARTPEGGLSGSTLSMDQALRNFLSFTNCKLEEALSMITLVPAIEMGISDRKGKIVVGGDADIVLLNNELFVEKTIVNGQIVYSKE